MSNCPPNPHKKQDAVSNYYLLAGLGIGALIGLIAYIQGWL